MLQGQMTATNNLLQFMALTKVNAAARGSGHVVKQIKDIGCVGCSGPHTTDSCPQNTKTFAFIRHDPYSNNYNLG